MEKLLTDFPVSDTAKPMGRPPLNVKMTPVRLRLDQLARIEKVAGPNKRAEFIRDAVDEKLDRNEASENPVQTDGGGPENG